VTYRRRPSALHAARAGAGIAYCAALAAAALLTASPLGLAGVLAAIAAAGVAAGAGRDVRRAARIALPLGLLIALVNALLVRDGLTVLWRFGDVPGFGPVDVTLEALVSGLVLGMRAVAIVLAAALYAVAVDPDEVLRLFRRISFRSALTATLATRMVPLLARDGRRLAEAQRARPGPPAPRLALVRAVSAGALDRAVDVAATLELRGYGSARPPARTHLPWSRHDVAVAGAAAGWAPFAAAGEAAAGSGSGLRIGAGPEAILLAGAYPLAALAPFLQCRGVAR
jgi:energy-coupling factor transport system permease protein